MQTLKLNRVERFSLVFFFQEVSLIGNVEG